VFFKNTTSWVLFGGCQRFLFHVGIHMILFPAIF
jgi:hypothetical protein